MTTCNPETGDMLSKLKTFKTQCAAFSARVRDLVLELNGEYGLWRAVQGYSCRYMCPWGGEGVTFLECVCSFFPQLHSYPFFLWSVAIKKENNKNSFSFTLVKKKVFVKFWSYITVLFLRNPCRIVQANILNWCTDFSTPEITSPGRFVPHFWKKICKPLTRGSMYICMPA